MEKQYKRVVVYYRIPSDDRFQASCIQLLRDHYRKFLKKKDFGWELTGLYTDEKYDSGNGGEQPGLRKILEDAESGIFDVIMIRSLSQLSRSLKECMDIIFGLRELPHPVGIFFVEDSLYTLDTRDEYTLQILSHYADDTETEG